MIGVKQQVQQGTCDSLTSLCNNQKTTPFTILRKYPDMKAGFQKCVSCSPQLRTRLQWRGLL